MIYLQESQSLHYNQRADSIFSYIANEFSQFGSHDNALYGHELKVYKQLDTSLTLSPVKGLIWSLSNIFVTVHQSMAAMYCKIFMNNVHLN